MREAPGQIDSSKAFQLYPLQSTTSAPYTPTSNDEWVDKYPADTSARASSGGAGVYDRGGEESETKILPRVRGLAQPQH
ncbi:hypothetical protein NLI96_g12217 [Meripilus lineatus]|uniref:Uncharacterized protein n=1 Tax=Meripilus lineatus TaxID=2056292 RepID=A0AAD5UV10_9APHY|nr:hypothetical protein NLI96_g12217 [Physisporinus lineatus]